MALSVSIDNDGFDVEGSTNVVRGELDFDSSYPRGGESLTAANVGLKTILRIDFEPVSGFRFEYDYSGELLKVFFAGAATTNGTVVDDDDAETAGNAIYFHYDEVLESGQFIGHLESATAGNANAIARIASGGPFMVIRDDDSAATGGDQIYLDEDAANSDERWLADLDSPGDRDGFVMLSDGSLLRIVDDDTASTNGVSIEFDDDATNDYERLRFISPTDADGTYATSTHASLRTGEVPNTFDLSGLTDVRFTVRGL